MTAHSAAGREEALFGTRVKPAAVKALKSRRTATLGELTAATGFPKSTISGAVRQLVAAGVVKPIPHGKTTRGFALTPAGEQLSAVIDVLSGELSLQSLPPLTTHMTARSLRSAAGYFTARRPDTRAVETTEDELTQPTSSIVWSGRGALD
jgi:DNA-binding MarR family transcriptional regulator